jgi:hypothetical protein
MEKKRCTMFPLKQLELVLIIYYLQLFYQLIILILSILSIDIINTRKEVLSKG